MKTNTKTQRIVALVVLALVLALGVAISAHAGAIGGRLLFKGSPAAECGTNRDFVVAGDGTGATRIKAVRSANPTIPLAPYVKAGGVRGPTAKGGQDAEWEAAQPYLWRAADGTPYTQGDFGWAYADLQRYPVQWAQAVVVPHLAAALAAVPAGTYTWAMIDNVIQQHPSLFRPKAPPDYDVRTYHDATLTVLREVRRALPSLKILANGYQGWAPVGLRGEALAGTDPATGLPFADGVWFEGVVFDTAGKPRAEARYVADLGVYLSMVTNGRVAVWDEPGVSGAKWRQAAGMWFAATGSAAANVDASALSNAYLNTSAGCGLDWYR